MVFENKNYGVGIAAAVFNQDESWVLDARLEP